MAVETNDDTLSADGSHDLGFLQLISHTPALPGREWSTLPRDAARHCIVFRRTPADAPRVIVITMEGFSTQPFSWYAFYLIVDGHCRPMVFPEFRGIEGGDAWVTYVASAGIDIEYRDGASWLEIAMGVF